MIGLGLTIFIVVILLVAAVILIPVAERTRIPHSVLLVLCGISIGIFSGFIELGLGFEGGSFLVKLNSMGMNSGSIFYLLLVPMVFDTALKIDVRYLIDDIGPILLLAVIGTLLSILLIGFSLAWATGLSVIACLLIGAICSSTDPLPIQEVFKDVGVPRRINLMVEGESLFSDSAALVAYTLLLAMLSGSAEPTLASGIFSFFEVTLGGIILGYIFARIFCWLLSIVGSSHIAKNTLSISLAYISFFLADEWFAYSGVIALVTAALVLDSRGRSDYSPSSWNLFLELSSQINFVAKSIVFLLVGIVIPSLISAFNLNDLYLLFILFIAAFAARAISVYVLLPVLTAIRLADPVENTLKTVMFWGAPRGAISLALLMAFLGTEGIDSETSKFIVTLVSAFVLLTILLNSTTMQALLKILKLKKLGKVDLAIKDRALFDALTELSEELESQHTASEQPEVLIKDAVNHFDSRARKIFETMAKRHDLDHSEWIGIALTTVAQYEKRIYLKYLENRLITPANARILLGMVSNLIDNVRHRGIQGYIEATKESIKFNWYVRFSFYLQEKFNIQGLLRNELAIRFDKLFAQVLVMEEIASNADTVVAKLVYRDLMDEVKEAIEFRLQIARDNLNHVSLAFPDYVHTLESNLHKVSVARLEQQKYLDMRDQVVISTEVFEDLMQEVESIIKAHAQSPKFDLKLDTENVFNCIPQISQFEEYRKKQLCSVFTPVISYPGQDLYKYLTKPDISFAIVNGSIELNSNGLKKVVHQGSLLLSSLDSTYPELIAVTATGYCRLLILNKKKFAALAVKDTEFKNLFENLKSDILET